MITIESKNKNIAEFEKALKLQINQWLYNSGKINTELYEKAKAYIVDKS